MKFIYISLLTLCLLSVALCAGSSTSSPQQSISSSQINQYINTAFQYSYMTGCNYTLVNGSVKYTLNNAQNGNFLLNFTANFTDTSKHMYPISVYANGTTNPQALFPLYSVNVRGDILPQFGFQFPNGKQYLSTNSSNLMALATTNNVYLGWPFYCSGYQSLAQNITIVNYIDYFYWLAPYKYITLAKINDGQGHCHNLLLTIENSYFGIGAIHFFVDCNPTNVPFI